MELYKINLTSRLRRSSPTKFVIVMTLALLASALVVGVIFAYGYLICKNNNDAPINSEFLKDYYPLYPFIMIAMVHSLYNTLITILHTLG